MESLLIAAIDGKSIENAGKNGTLCRNWLREEATVAGYEGAGCCDCECEDCEVKKCTVKQHTTQVV